MDSALLRSTLTAWLHRGRTLARTLLAPPDDATDSGLLPDFCSGWIVFNVVVVAEMIAIVLSLMLPDGLMGPNSLIGLLLVSVFVQWVALAGTAVLCRLRRYLNKLPNLRAIVMAYLALLATTFAVGEIAVLVLWLAGQSSSLRPAWYGNFQVFNLTISAVAHGLLLRYFLAKHELTQRTRSEARARLQALQSRIRPHFVFNSLNIIASLTRNEPAKAEAAIEDMADLFRMMLTEDEMLVPVKNEIDTAKKYLALEALRLDNRLTVNWDIGTYPRKAAIPVLTLQPILEYAIRHGVEDQTEGGTVEAQLREENDTIQIRVVAPAPRTKSRRADIARDNTLENIRLRLQNHYGDTAQLGTQEENGQTTITVRIPTRGGTT
jgi:two-component system sensor histidine kinase AlgZ